MVIDLGCGTGLCGKAFRDLADRLIGVDLSPRAIEIARDKGIYDDLLTGELTATLLARPRVFDPILASDVLAYIGELETLFSACAGALCEKGRFAFTTEACEDTTAFELLPQGRFAHGRQYLQTAIREAGLCVEHCSSDILRVENQHSVHCHVIVVKCG